MFLYIYRSIPKAQLLFVIITVAVVLRRLATQINKIRVLTNDVRGRNPHARFLTAVPIMVSVAHLLGTFGACFGIGLGAFLFWNMRRGYLSRLLWSGFALNFVAVLVMELSYALVKYSY